MRDQKLPGDYIAGFVDGEGCFSLKYRTDRQHNKSNKTFREYHYWGAEFAIVLHPSDTDLLKLIRDAIGVGKISFKKTGDQVRLSVQSTKELKNIIVPYFKRNQLYGMKARDFELWCKAVKIIAAHKERTMRGHANPMDKATQKSLELIKLEIDTLKRREVV